MSSKKNTQRLFTIGFVLFVGAILLYAFWPRAIAVDIAHVKTEPMQLTISEEGKTQVHLTGQILQIQQKSENSLLAGTPIITIGDTTNDLEVLVELLSTDAVNVAVGNAVVISNWGGNSDLHGTIAKIEPFAFTKYSALGVEEQRVNVIVKFSDSADKYQKLGQGFRVEAHIIVWQDDSALVVPSGALFRVNNKWAVFKIHKGIAQLTSVNVGYNNGTQAQILSGLNTGEQVVLYPTPQLVDGVSVVQR